MDFDDFDKFIRHIFWPLSNQCLSKTSDLIEFDCLIQFNNYLTNQINLNFLEKIQKETRRCWLSQIDELAQTLYGSMEKMYQIIFEVGCFCFLKRIYNWINVNKYYYYLFVICNYLLLLCCFIYKMFIL